MGDIIKIRKTLANLTGDLDSSLSSNTSGASDTTEEPSVTEPGDHVRSNYCMPKQLHLQSTIKEVYKNEPLFQFYYWYNHLANFYFSG